MCRGTFWREGAILEERGGTLRRWGYISESGDTFRRGGDISERGGTFWRGVHSEPHILCKVFLLGIVKNVLVPTLPARGNERVLGSETTMAHHAPACRADGFRTNIAERENTAAHTYIESANSLVQSSPVQFSPANKDTPITMLYCGCTSVT